MLAHTFLCRGLMLLAHLDHSLNLVFRIVLVIFEDGLVSLLVHTRDDPNSFLLRWSLWNKLFLRLMLLSLVGICFWPLEDLRHWPASTTIGELPLMTRILVFVWLVCI